MKFNTESPLFHFLGTMADYVLLNCLFLITCIPIITIGAASSALYAITLRDAREEHGYLIVPYLKAFRVNIKKGTALFLLYFTIGAVLLFNYVFWLKIESSVSNVILIILTFVTALYFFSLFYVFPLNARFENTVRQTMKNALFIAMSNLKYTVALLAILIAALVLCYTTAVCRVAIILFGFSFLAFCQSFIINKIFKNFE